MPKGVYDRGKAKKPKKAAKKAAKKTVTPKRRSRKNLAAVAFLDKKDAMRQSDERRNKEFFALLDLLNTIQESSKALFSSQIQDGEATRVALGKFVSAAESIASSIRQVTDRFAPSATVARPTGVSFGTDTPTVSTVANVGTSLVPPAKTEGGDTEGRTPVMILVDEESNEAIEPDEPDEATNEATQSEGIEAAEAVEAVLS